MYIFINGKYRPLEGATTIEPIIETPARLKVRIIYPDTQAIFSDRQVPLILQHVYSRRVGTCPDRAMEAVLQAVSDALDNLDGHEPEPKRRRPRVLKDREGTVRICSLMASARHAEDRGEIEKATEYRRQADEIRAKRSQTPL